MTSICAHCAAFHWVVEHLKESPISAPCFSLCCHHGKVILDVNPEPPNHLCSLFTAQTTEAKEFRENIRQYNSALTFTSFTAKEKNDNTGGCGPWVWKSGYTIYYCADTLLPNAQSDPKYAQLCFYDPDEALCYCMKCNYSIKRDMMAYLQDMLLQTNHYKPLFLHMFELLESTPSRDLSFHIVADPSIDLRQYNEPTVDEIAVILPGQQDHAHDPHDIILHPCDGNLEFIHDHHHAYTPLHYVLLFPYGTAGWTYGLALEHNANNALHNNDVNPPQNHKHMSQVQFFSYCLHT